MPVSQSRIAHRLVQLGVLLFLLGLLVGFAVPALANPRMGLASHLEGVMNGLFLMALGLMWPKVALSERLQTIGFGLAAYGAFANLAATFLAAAWGAGEMMPLAAGDRVGGAGQEAVIRVLLVSLSLADVVVCVLVLVGLRRTPESA
jgi:hydroxylaminobenzene mutase